MKHIACYDIGNDKKRRLVSKLLVNHGFIRIQRSVYIGENIKNIEVLQKKIEDILENDEYSLFFGRVNNLDIYDGKNKISSDEILMTNKHYIFI